jgi:type I restriction enzyme M protein
MRPNSGEVTAGVFEQIFRNVDDVLWKEAGCTTELDYTEQTSWLLFLKYLDSLEQDLADEAALAGKKYKYILEKPYRWESWAAPKGKNGKLDENKALTGDDLRDFVNQKLFPYLQAIKQNAAGPNTIEYKIGEIFGEIKNKISSGYNMREIIGEIDGLRFRSQTEKHELSHLYEAKIRNMGNAGRNGGEYYTPRPLIRAMVQVVAPKLGERIYDGAVGSAGFLCEAYDYLQQSYPKRTTAQDRTLEQAWQASNRRLRARLPQPQACHCRGQGVGRTGHGRPGPGQGLRQQTHPALRLRDERPMHLRGRHGHRARRRSAALSNTGRAVGRDVC